MTGTRNCLVSVRVFGTVPRRSGNWTRESYPRTNHWGDRLGSEATLRWIHPMANHGGGGFIGTLRTSRVSDLQTQLRQPNVYQRLSYVRIALGKTFEEYCRTTKVNGPHYWQKGVTRGRGRLIWTIIPIALMATGLLLVFSLWQRYLSSPTRMTIGSPLSVVDVPFPAVTICHPRTVVHYKAEDFVERV